jgi:hypothetical protein
MLYCQSSPDDHRSAAVYALSFSRDCGHPYPTRLLACLQHGAEMRSNPTAAEPTPCEQCGEESALTLARVEDVFEERVVVSILRSTLELSVHSPVTFAFDRASRLAVERGLQPVPTYRMPVQWQNPASSRATGGDIVDACVTLAVTVPPSPVSRAG